MNATPPKVIYLVISLLGITALVGVVSLCMTLFFRNYADPAVLTAIISITSGSLGSLGTMLVSTRSQPIDGKPPPAAPVLVTNPPENPVPVEAMP